MEARKKAQIILEQMGGSRFLAMTGAKNLIHDSKGSLSFKLPRFAGLKINHVKIEITPDDLYKMVFGRIYGMKYTVLEEVEGVYFDMLQSVFTQKTGLDTHL